MYTAVVVQNRQLENKINADVTILGYLELLHDTADSSELLS